MSARRGEELAAAGLIGYLYAKTAKRHSLAALVLAIGLSLFLAQLFVSAFLVQLAFIYWPYTLAVVGGAAVVMVNHHYRRRARRLHGSKYASPPEFGRRAESER